MTNSRVKGQLSETTKTELEKLWVEVEYGRKMDVKTKYTEKGIQCEQLGIDLLNNKDNRRYFKNVNLYSNDFIIGTPDVVSTDIYDIKISWDLLNFVKSKEDKARKDYYYQLLGYMMLTETKVGFIVYCLVNTPQIFITDELYKATFQMAEDSQEYKAYKTQLIKNMTFNDIPEEKRIKVFKFERDENQELVLKARVIEWRAYMNSLSL